MAAAWHGRVELQRGHAAAARKGLASRWGAPRKPSRMVRLDADAVEALRAVPERDRRRVASDAIREAVAYYKGEKNRRKEGATPNRRKTR